MEILIDQNNLLTIADTENVQGKQYHYNTSGYNFSDFDKQIIIYHKKNIKIINLKNLSDTMQIIWIKERSKKIENKLDIPNFINAFTIFVGRNEDQNQKYFFLPKINVNKIETINYNLKTLGVDLNIQQTDKGICLNQNHFENSMITHSMSFLFGLTMIYGKMDIKSGTLTSIQIQIPLFGQYIKYKEELDNMIAYFAEEGIFLKSSTIENNDGISYQISSSDYELMESFRNFYQSIEKIDQILKHDLTIKVQEELIEFMTLNNVSNKDEIINTIKNGTMKLLEK